MTNVRPVVALLVDADNAALGSLDQVLTALAEHGDVTIRRAYGNWFKSALKAWDPELNRRGIRPVQQSDPVHGKNATDLALVIDAVDLHHTTRPDVYALVSSDSDYTPLAHFLRERGVTVIGFGRANTAESFRVACTLFVPIPDAVAGKPTAESQAAADAARTTRRRDRQERRQAGLGPSQRSREPHASTSRSVRKGPRQGHLDQGAQEPPGLRVPQRGHDQRGGPRQEERIVSLCHDPSDRSAALTSRCEVLSSRIDAPGAGPHLRSRLHGEDAVRLRVTLSRSTQRVAFCWPSSILGWSTLLNL